MDSIIEAENFVHDDKNVEKAFEQRVHQWKDTSGQTSAVGQIISGFQAIGKKVMGTKCPTYKTHGWKSACTAFDTLEDIVGDQIVMGAIHPSEFHDLFYKLVIDCFQAGPSTISLKFINSLLSHKHLGLKEYTTSLRDEMVNKLLRAITSPLIKKEDTSDKEFYSVFRSYLDEILSAAFDQSQLMMDDSMKLLLDFKFHLHLDYLHLTDEAVRELDYTAKAILRRYSDKWKTFSDVSRLKSYIQKYYLVAKTPGFPRSKAMANLIYESLALITKQLPNVGHAEAFAIDLLDYMEVAACAQGDREHVLRAFSAAIIFFDQRDANKNNPTLFKLVAPRFKQLVSTIDVAFIKETRLVSDVMVMLENSYARNNELSALWLSICIPLTRRNTIKSLNACRRLLSDYEKIKWKEHQQFVHELLGVIKELERPADDSKDPCLKEVKSIVGYVLNGLKRARIMKSYGKTIMYLAIHMLELNEKELYNCAEDLGESIEINMKENKESAMEVMQRIYAIIKNPEFPLEECWPFERALIDIMNGIFESVKDPKIFSDEDFEFFTSMCVTCLEKGAINQDSGNLSHHFHVAMRIMKSLIPWLGAVKKVAIANDLIPILLRIMDDDETEAHTCAACHLIDFTTHDKSTLKPFFDEFIRIYLDREIDELMMPITQIYQNCTVSLKNHFQALFTEMMESDNKRATGQLPSLFWTASTKEAELFTEDNIKALIDRAKDDSTQQGVLLQVISGVCKRRPGKFIKIVDLLMNTKDWNPHMLSIINDILCTLALYDKKVSEKIVNYFINIAKTESDKAVLITALNSIRLIGFKFLDVIKPNRQHIERLQLIDGDAQGMKQHVLDMIDGKTPDDVKKQLEAQQEAVSGLVERVDEVEGTVAGVVAELGEQRQDLDNVKNDVTEHGQRLEQVEEVVDETVKKVEEIDNKTLSHAPYWSRDISKLLNPASDHDWRLLSSRLGYSNSDIRGWAQQADPCMAMLNEWYATRKTSEATDAILTHLQEMNCHDAALIVENAMKKAEAVVEDEEFEYASPPEIFISYQWGHQEEVKLLHRHLAMAGYDCWMDIGQMGGGDKLFEKIDNGMRAAKLVIGCVTTKYAKSPNCNREVNLAVGVNKPIIPLLLESCKWPPPGSMGPIFSESLYIRFFQTGQEQTKDDRYWSEDKFQELLMQISANGLTPNEGKVDKVYKNWWMPLEQQINIDKSKTRDGGKQPVEDQSKNEKSEESPDVFISYQWGKQKNIIKLYQRLTSLGFSCWLDIKQMGGGDSLYDKIDRGIRGSKVVVSCVTKKYALSANCRREVSLTDALKKPMLPLLLEDMTWPPSGPMSMIMTQLLYIGFQKESLQTTWMGSEFDQLIEKLESYTNMKSAVTGKASSNKENEQKTSDCDVKKVKDAQPKSEREGNNIINSSTNQTNATNEKERRASVPEKSNQRPKPEAKNNLVHSSTHGKGPASSQRTEIQPRKETHTPKIATQPSEAARNDRSNDKPGTSKDELNRESEETSSQQPKSDNSDLQHPKREDITKPERQETDNVQSYRSSNKPNETKTSNLDPKSHDNKTAEMRPRSSVPPPCPGPYPSPSQDRLLPPPNLRPTTSKSCTLL